MCASIAYEFMFAHLQYTLTHLFKIIHVIYCIWFVGFHYSTYILQVSQILPIFPSSIVNSALNCV